MESSGSVLEQDVLQPEGWRFDPCSPQFILCLVWDQCKNSYVKHESDHRIEQTAQFWSNITIWSFDEFAHAQFAGSCQKHMPHHHGFFRSSPGSVSGFLKTFWNQNLMSTCTKTWTGYSGACNRTHRLNALTTYLLNSIFRLDKRE